MDWKSLILIAIFLVHNSYASSYSTPATVHVSGKVVCQDCSKSFYEWDKGNRPIKGCKVSLTCTDYRGRVVFYDSDVTDELGTFNIFAGKYRRNGKELNEKRCEVRLLSSPDPTCNILTNYGNGKTGVKLREPVALYSDAVKYLVGPFYSTTPMCDIPITDPIPVDDPIPITDPIPEGKGAPGARY